MIALGCGGLRRRIVLVGPPAASLEGVMLLVAIFVIGYLAITLEQPLGLNKSAAALLTGVLCWTVHLLSGDAHAVNAELLRHLADLSQVLFFLLAALTIVETIDAHDGFHVLTSRITTTNRRRLLYTLAAVAFFLSAVLDNLTTAIVMMSLVRRLVPERKDRLAFAGAVVIAANAGGVWSPIGDVTTTMLWVGDQITTTTTILRLFVPALVSVVVPVLWIGRSMKGSIERSSKGASVELSPSSVVPGVSTLTLPAAAFACGKTLGALGLRQRTGVSVVGIRRGGALATPAATEPLEDGDVLAISGADEAIPGAIELLVTGEAPKTTTPRDRRIVLGVGAVVLLFVPALKAIAHLPPMMGILLGLGVLWTVTETIHKRKPDGARGTLSVSSALQRIDTPSILFFLGILLAVTALESAGHLRALADVLARVVGNVDAVTLLIGLTSSVVDNVPLVAAAQGMYSLAAFPTDHRFWLFLAYCAGTGGSILIIGSAAGVAVMGIERISFGSYLRRMSLPALAGYAAGALVFLAESVFFHN